MPLPLIPLILGGASAIASAFGIKKGIDAKSDFEMAEYLNKKAQFVYEESSKELQSAYNNTRQSMNILGETKFRIYEKSIIPFVECFSMIKKIDFNDSQLLEAGNLPKITKDELNELQKTTLEMKDVQLLLGPHPTLEDMHDFIITRWNLRVHDIDEVIIIGDIFIGERKTVDKANDMLNRLKGNKYLIPGNHDNIEFLKGISRVRQKDGILPTFEVLPHLVEKRFPLETKNSKHYSLVCSHYPLASWSTVAKGIGHVHGHCHQAYRGRILDVGWDSIYTGGPGIWSVAEIKEYMDSQEIFSVDYH